jgi:gag-polypeptide of LTR copia-type
VNEFNFTTKYFLSLYILHGIRLASLAHVILPSASLSSSISLFAMASSSSSQPTAFSYELPLKLNHDNYLYWKFLILPHARGHDLLGFLDGSNPPPLTISGTDGYSVSNPAYTFWIRQDQLLLAWLLSSISEAVVSQVIHCTTSAELWNELHQCYSTHSLVSMMDLKMRLHSL